MVEMWGRRVLLRFPMAKDVPENARDMRKGLMNTDFAPDANTAVGIAQLLRKLCAEEFKESRLEGSPLAF